MPSPGRGFSTAGRSDLDWRQLEEYGLNMGRRLVLDSRSGSLDRNAPTGNVIRELLSPQPDPGGKGSKDPAGGSSSSSDPTTPPNAFQTLDPNVVIILVVLLFALICAAFLNSVMRCLLRRSRGVARVDPPQSGIHHFGTGLDAKTLASLPTFTFKAAENEKAKEVAVADCTICLSEFTENESLRLLPKCNHVFHLDCIDMWLLSHVSCPVCRDAIADDPNVHSIVFPDADSTGIDDPSEITITQDSASTSNLRAELLRDHSSRRVSSDAVPTPSAEVVPAPRRSVRSTLISMLASENLFSAVRAHQASSNSTASSSSSVAAVPTTGGSTAS